jgi:hypothetical protein
MRKNQGVELVLKPINMHGGGYSNFLRQIKKEAQTNYLARFIIVDADRITTVSGEKENFLKLLEYCRIQNDTLSDDTVSPETSYSECYMAFDRCY